MVEPIRYDTVRTVGGRPVILKDGRPSIKGEVHHWCICDVCSEFQLIATDDLKTLWRCSECGRTSSRKGSLDEAPTCKGRTHKGQKTIHEPTPMTTTDRAPGRDCKMTPRCIGKARRINP